MKRRAAFDSHPAYEDRGAPFGRTDAAPAKTGVIFETEDSQTVIYNGNGDKTWLIDTTAGNVVVSLPAASADAALGPLFTVKRLTAGANTLTVTPESGNIDGSATYSLPTQYLKVTVVSDGSNYWTI